MKKLNLTILLAVLLSMVGAKASAHDIEVNNADGVTIYYVWRNNNTELAVSYRGTDYYDYYDEYSGNVVIPESVTYEGTTYSVTSIGSWAFDNCWSLTSVTIPNSVTSIGNRAFDNCSDLTSVTIPNSVTSIGGGAFAGTGWYNNQADGLLYLDNWLLGHKGDMPTGDIVIKDGTKGIAGYAFQNCSGLTSVAIPNSVTSIGNDAFSGCSGLTSVTIPNSVTSIGDGVFSGCDGLTSVSIPNSVTSIGVYAFAYCSGLTSVTIGNGVTVIGMYAFAFCHELTDVYCYAENIPSTNTGAFEGSYIGNATLHVPDASLGSYSSTAPWSSFGTKVAIDKCATPTIIVAGKKISFQCETPDAEFTSYLTSEEHFEGAEVELDNVVTTFTLTVYATAPGYDRSEPAQYVFSTKKGDVNGDGVVDVSDYIGIANIILFGTIDGNQ